MKKGRNNKSHGNRGVIQPPAPKETIPEISNYGSFSTKSSFVLERDFKEEITQQRALKNTNLRFIGFNIVNGKNTFLNQIVGSEQYSPTFSAVHKSLINYAFGGGFKFSPDISEADKLFLEQERNAAGETLLDTCQNSGVDYNIFGNAYLLLRKGQSGSYISNLKIYHCRPVKNDQLGRPTHVAISPHFEEDKTNSIPENEITILPIYPNFDIEEVDGVKFQSSIIHIKNYSSTASYWGMPSWKAALFYMEMEYRAARYNISEFENGFVPSSLINLKGNYSPDKQKEILKMLKDNFLNTGNNGKLLVTFGLEEFNTQQFDSRKEGQYLEMLKIAESQILKATLFTPAMAGIETSGKLGSNQQLRDEYENVTKKVVQPFQKEIFEAVVIPYLESTNRQGQILGFNQNSPISMRSQIDINKVATIDELREMLGLPPLTQEQRNELQKLPTIQ
jgi:Phage portal protein